MSSACRHAVGVATSPVVSESHSAGNGEAWATLVVKLPPEDHNSVYATAADAVMPRVHT